MELNTIKNNGSWSELAGLLNDNFAKINTQLLKYQDVDAIDGINFVGYVTSVDLLPTPKVASWAVVGADIKEVSVCAYYLEGSVPVNMTAGWNVLRSLGTYDFTDYSNLLTKVEETDAKVSELGSKQGEVSPKVLFNGGADVGINSTSWVFKLTETTEEDYAASMFFTGAEIFRIRFYKDEKYTTIGENNIEKSGDSFIIPQGTYSVGIFYNTLEGNSTTKRINLTLSANTLLDISNAGLLSSRKNQNEISLIKQTLGDVDGKIIYEGSAKNLQPVVLPNATTSALNAKLSIVLKSGTMPIGIRFYKDANYTTLAEFEITSEENYFLLPSGAYSFYLLSSNNEAGDVDITLSANTIDASLTIMSEEINDVKKEIEDANGKIADNDVKIEDINKSIRNHSLIYQKKSFGAITELPIEINDLQYGYFMENGEFANHGKRVASKAIYIGGNNTFNIIRTGTWAGQSIATEIFIYKMLVDGSLEFSRRWNGNDNQYWTTRQNQIVSLAKDETHIRFYCEFLDSSWQSTKIELADFNKYVKVYYRPYSDAYATTRPIEISKKLTLLNSNVGWVLGQTNIATSKIDYATNTPISVISGNRYLFNAKSGGNISQIQFFTSKDGISWKGNGWVTYNAGSPPYNSIFQIPKDVEWLNVCVSLNNEPNELFDLDGYEMTLWNTTLDKVCYSDMILPLVKNGQHYAQGMDINNGYIFQGFATGEIEIYRLSDRKHIQTIEMPMMGDQARHLGVLKFSNEKVAEDDDFNVMWIPSEAIGYKDIAVRWLLNDGIFSYEIVKELADLPNRPSTEERTDRSKFGYDIVDGRYVSMFYNINEYKSQSAISEGYPTIEIYSVSSWDENAEYTLQRSINLNEGYALQMALLQKDKMYIPVGTGLSAMTLWVVDLFNEELSQIIDLTQFGIDVEEPQNFTIYNGQVYLSTVHGIYIINL